MVDLTNEASLLQKIEELAAKRKIHSSVGLTEQAAETKIQKLIPTTRQRINAVRFYQDLMENMNYASYLRSQSSLSEEQKLLVDFSDGDLQVQINLLNRETFPLVLFILLNGFFSNLVSLEDCVAKVINIIYDLIPYNKRYSGLQIRQELRNKIPNGNLTRHLRLFHDKKDSTFNIAKKIRNRLTHDDITDIVDFPPTINLSGSVVNSELKLRFRHSFFPANISNEVTETFVFCKSVFEDTEVFINECYKLIYKKLQRSGALPV